MWNDPSVVAFDCYNKKDGDYENPTDACSPDYVSCSGGIAVFKSCQAGLAFDVVSTKCLQPQFVPWCPGGVETTTGAPDVGFTTPPPFCKLWVQPAPQKKHCNSMKISIVPAAL